MTYTIDVREIAKEMTDYYSDDNEYLIKMAEDYFYGEDTDFLDEVRDFIDIESMADEIAEIIIEY